MDSLPVELISRIFINTLPPELDDTRYRVDELTLTQAAISCVCHRCNQIAKSTPELWTFIILSNRAKLHDSVRKRLELSGTLPLNVSIRLSREETDNESWGNSEVWENESFYEMHTLLLEQLLRWKTLRVEATVNAPSELRQWIPFELPNVVGLSLHVVVLGPATFPLTYCPLLQEYHTSGIGFLEVVTPSRTSVWKELVAILSKHCPRMEVLQVATDSGRMYSTIPNASQGDWPLLPSLTTLRFVNGATSMNIRCILNELKAPQLRRVEFQDYLIIAALNQEIRFPVKNDGRIALSMMSTVNNTELLARITNAADLEVELDLDTIVDGHPQSQPAETWHFRRSPEYTSQLRGWWESVQLNIPKVSWVVPSDEGEGNWKRVGGADLSFDDAIAYLDRRWGVLLKIYYKQPWPPCAS